MRNPDFGKRTTRRLALRALLAVIAAGTSGCAAFRNDLDGLPARYLPEEYRVESERGKRTIDLSMLRRTPPAEYRLDAGDVLGVYIEGVLGEPRTLPPVYNASGQFDRPNTGYPITVREDGTIALPLDGSVAVRGLSLREAEARLRDYYTRTRPLLRPGRSRVLVSLLRPRTHRILVVRQESGNRQGNIGSAGTVNFEIDKRGTGRVVELPAYRNDVLNALAETGGLPGLDAQNAIYVIRRPRPVVDPPCDPGACERPEVDFVPSDLWSPEPAEASEPGSVSATLPTVIWKPGFDAGRSDVVARGQSPTRSQYSGIRHASFESFGSRHNRVRQIMHGKSLAANAEQWPVETAPRPPMPTHGPPPLRGPVPVDPRYTSPAAQDYESTAVPSYDVHREPMSFGNLELPPEAIPYTLDQETLRSERIIRIPLRMHPGQPVPFRPEDVVLHDGDVVFIETREMEFFYTGGLLGGGQFPLPRDFDLNVLEAIAVVERDGSSRSALDRSLSGPSATGLDVTTSASELVILRTLPDGREVPIKVDLYAALTDPAERVLIAPGDYLFLKYTRSEAWGAWLERWLFDNVATGVNNSRYVTGGNN